MRYYSVDDVARILGVSRMSIYRYIDEGKLRAVKLRGEEAGRVKVPHEALIEYLQENTTTEAIFKMKRKRDELLRILKECEACKGCDVVRKLEVVCEVLEE